MLSILSCKNIKQQKHNSKKEIKVKKVLKKTNKRSIIKAFTNLLNLKYILKCKWMTLPLLNVY